MTKTIYFVRHGESEGNVSNRKAGLDPELTPQGERQAQFVAKRFVGIAIDIIIASPLVRAAKTAEYIKEQIHVPIIHDELVLEWKIPEKMVGVLKSECPTMVEMVDDEFAKNGIFPGGESFSELKARAFEFMKMIEGRPEKNILIASHDVFLHMLAACVLFGTNLTHDEFALVYERLKASNTGISIFHLQPEKIKNPWIILTWNDSSHI